MAGMFQRQQRPSSGKCGGGRNKRRLALAALAASFGCFALVAFPDLSLRDLSNAAITLPRRLTGSSSSSRQLFLRGLSLNLGNGTCQWEAANLTVPDAEFQKTLIAGFPSGDKRMVFLQMEGLTGLKARDEWEFKYQGITNHPFIKANYPHHEGVWGWGDEADQVLLVVRNIRRSMVEYHDILWDIGFAETFEDAFQRIENLYVERPPIEDFLLWRDLRVIDEISWYGWFIDYYMESGLMRDMFTKNMTTPQHWYKLMEPTGYSRDQLAYDVNVGNDAIVVPSYDPVCDHISGGCHPVRIVSGERLLDHDEGPLENRKIAQAMQGNQGVDDYLIEEEAWDCIWEELIVHKKGARIFTDRPGYGEIDYNFSAEMLDLMIAELDYLITKYSGSAWSWRQTSQELVEILLEHKGLLVTELNEVNSGQRQLRLHDFLGKETRKKMMEVGGRKLVGHENTKRFDFAHAENAITQRRRERRLRFDFSYAEQKMAERRRAWAKDGSTKY